MNEETKKHNQDYAILDRLVNCIKKRGEFSGTSRELGIALGLGRSPRLLMDVKQLNGELENRGIFTKFRLRQGKVCVVITNSRSKEEAKKCV